MKTRTQRGFTLIELLIVVTVIAILAGITLRVAYYAKQKTAKGQVQYAISQIRNALVAYYAAYGSYPPAQQMGNEYEYMPPPLVPEGGCGYGTGLVTYILYGPNYNEDPVAQEWQHYLDDVRGGPGKIPRSGSVLGGGFTFWTNMGHTILDPWWRGYCYTSAAPEYQSYMLWSVGPNGVNEWGGGDDIGSGWIE